MKKRTIVISVAAIVIAVCSLLFYSLIISASETTSPDKAHWVSYNRITKTITVARVNSGIRWYVTGFKNPVFLWSPNSRFIAMTFTDESGNRRSEVMDIELSNSTIIPTQLDTQMTVTNEKTAQVEVLEWLDNDNIIVGISYKTEENRSTVGGSFIFTLSSYTINANTE